VAFPLWPTAFLFPLALCFYYFLLAGARTFEHDPTDDLGSGLAQFSFLVTGTIGTIFLGFRAVVPVANAVASAALMLFALVLYEWSRRTIRDRRFQIAWSGRVPEAVCDEGPYRHVRHPVYLSYMFAFAAIPAALPRWESAAILLFNVALFGHAARDDEHAMTTGELAEEYARYKARTGMFVPRLRKRAA
jgi:protein-S-isoprenylcysteine O-methyltransferase Ste14